MITGTLLANEGFALRRTLNRKQVPQPIGKPAFDFLVMMEKEEEESVTT